MPGGLIAKGGTICQIIRYSAEVSRRRILQYPRLALSVSTTIAGMGVSTRQRLLLIILLLSYCRRLRFRVEQTPCVAILLLCLLQLWSLLRCLCKALFVLLIWV